MGDDSSFSSLNCLFPPTMYGGPLVSCLPVGCLEQPAWHYPFFFFDFPYDTPAFLPDYALKAIQVFSTHYVFDRVTPRWERLAVFLAAYEDAPPMTRRR